MSESLFKQVIGLLAVIGGFAIAAMLVFYDLPEGNKDLFNFVALVLLAWGTVVIHYLYKCYGSSEGSKRKTELMSDTSKAEAKTRAKVEEVKAEKEGMQ